MIRGNGASACPFGLPAIEACKCAGNCVDRMAPVDQANEQETERLARANRIVYAYCKEKCNCKYADKIIESKEKVDCDFGDTGAGQRTPSFRGSPLYPQTFHGIGLDGLYGYPLGYYSDNNESRNMFFGLFSLIGTHTIQELVKVGDQYDKSGELEKANIVDDLLVKLKGIRDNNRESFDTIESYLEEFRKKYDRARSDTGLLWDLSQKWYGARQSAK